MRIIFLIVICMFSITVHAAKYSATGVVQDIKMFSENPNIYNTEQLGRVFIYLNELPKACASNEKRIAISSNHPLFDSVLSVALVSKTTQTPVEIWYLDSCSQRSNAWDFSIMILK